MRVGWLVSWFAGWFCAIVWGPKQCKRAFEAWLMLLTASNMRSHRTNKTQSTCAAFPLPCSPPFPHPTCCFVSVVGVLSVVCSSSGQTASTSDASLEEGSAVRA